MLPCRYPAVVRRARALRDGGHQLNVIALCVMNRASEKSHSSNSSQVRSVTGDFMDVDVTLADVRVAPRARTKLAAASDKAWTTSNELELGRPSKPCCDEDESYASRASCAQPLSYKGKSCRELRAESMLVISREPAEPCAQVACGKADSGIPILCVDLPSVTAVAAGKTRPSMPRFWQPDSIALGDSFRRLVLLPPCQVHPTYSRL